MMMVVNYVQISNKLTTNILQVHVLLFKKIIASEIFYSRCYKRIHVKSVNVALVGKS